MKLTLTDAEYKRILHALRLAADWEDSCADAYRRERGCPQNPPVKQPKEFHTYKRSARAFIKLYEKLKGEKYVDPIEAALAGSKGLTFKEIEAMTREKEATTK